MAARPWHADRCHPPPPRPQVLDFLNTSYPPEPLPKIPAPSAAVQQAALAAPSNGVANGNSRGLEGASTAPGNGNTRLSAAAEAKVRGESYLLHFLGQEVGAACPKYRYFFVAATSCRRWNKVLLLRKTDVSIPVPATHEQCPALVQLSNAPCAPSRSQGTALGCV